MIFREIKQIFQMKISEKNLEFIIDVDEDLPPALILDETRLRQVLLNLVGNAVKFTETGSIKLTVKKRSNEKDQSCLDLIISVDDTGIGIPESEVESIFESFKQQEGQSIRKYGGTGLGLAISKRLTEMMNGQINVISTVGKGSVFEIILREIKVSSINMTVVSPDMTFDLKNVFFEPAKVLVVDDIEPNRKLIREILSLVGLEISEAENGQQAVLLAEESSPDLILMDIRMPVMDGYAATKNIKTNPKTNNIPVIALTASVTAGSPEKMKELGFDAYLSKPVNMYELIKELSRYLKSHEKETSINTTSENSKARFTSEEVMNFPELMSVIESEIMPEYNQFKDAVEMDLIEDFAQRLIELSKKHNSKLLMEYADNLTEFVQLFDIEQIEHSINDFPALINKLKGNEHYVEKR